VFDQIRALALADLRNDGRFQLPGILVLQVNEVEAKPESEGINPFTGEAMTFEAVPAKTKVKGEVDKRLKKAVFEEAPSSESSPDIRKLATVVARQLDAPKKDVEAFLVGLSGFAAHQLRDAGRFELPGIATFELAEREARSARSGTNPFTGEEKFFAARPAKTKIKVRANSGLRNEVRGLGKPPNWRAIAGVAEVLLGTVSGVLTVSRVLNSGPSPEMHLALRSSVLRIESGLKKL